MSEQELRDGLRLAVADEPPMNFDVDELVTTAERLVRRRRALIAVGASTAAVAIAAVAIPVFLGNAPKPADLPVAAAPPPVTSVKPSTTVPPTVTPTSRPSPDKARLIERGAQMQTHLRRQFPLVVPNAKQPVPGPFSGEAEGDVEDGQRYLGSMLRFTLGVPTAIEVHVQLDQENVDRTCPTDCTQVSQPDGSVVLIQLVRDGGPGKMTVKSATHFRNDGSMVRVTTYNYDPTAQNETTYHADVALTPDQLVRLATDPALHL